MGLQFVLPDNIIQAVAHVDKFYIDCAIPVDVRNQGEDPYFGVASA